MKKKIIVFGLGNDWEEWRDEIDKKYEIIGVSDNSIKARGGVYKFISPADIAKEEFDFLMICSSAYHEEIQDQLVEKCNIKPDKIKLYEKIADNKHKNLTREIYDNMETEKMLLGKMCLETIRHKWKAQFQCYKEIEFKVFSQFCEDGIIQYLINTIDIENETFIEFGVEDYKESNTRFLLQNDNWSGYVLDGSKKNTNRIKNESIYWKYDLTAVHAFIHKENINDLIKKSGFSKNIGILSIDIDGNDYWIWEAIDIISPNIVICEYNALLGDKDAVTIPYKEDFTRIEAHYSGLYCGASLQALIFIGMKKGYTLVCTESHGCNAFFVRNDLLNDRLKIEGKFHMSKSKQSRDEKGNLSYLNNKEALQIISHMPVVDVKTGRIRNVME